jgi:hypothetical protein
MLLVLKRKGSVGTSRYGTSTVLNQFKPYCGRAVYGFVLYLLSNSLLLLYFAWALLPDSYLQVRHREINGITFMVSTGT